MSQFDEKSKKFDRVNTTRKKIIATNVHKDPDPLILKPKDLTKLIKSLLMGHISVLFSIRPTDI